MPLAIWGFAISTDLVVLEPEDTCMLDSNHSQSLGLLPVPVKKMIIIRLGCADEEEDGDDDASLMHVLVKYRKLPCITHTQAFYPSPKDRLVSIE